MKQNASFAEELVALFIEREIKHFFFAPGARNSPFIYSLIKSKEAKTISHFDERGLGFLALGKVKKTGEPAVILSTSGSAIANFYPAVLEAHYNDYPLMVITADRPEALHNLNANQTITQHHFFNGFVRYYKNFIIGNNFSNNHHLFQMSYGLSKLFEGPVHFNVQFDEPLLEKKTISHQKSKKYLLTPIEKKIPSLNLTKVIKKFSSAKFPLIIVGKLEASQEKNAIKALLHYLNTPFFLDIASGLRGLVDSPLEVDYYPLLLKNDKIKNYFKKNIDFVLHLGSSVISKDLQGLLQEIDAFYYQVDKLTLPFNPQLNIDEKLVFDVNVFAGAFLKYCKKNSKKSLSPKTASPFLLEKIKKSCLTIINNFLKEKTLNELTLAQTIFSFANKSHLYLGNSMVIRDYDFVAFKGEVKNIIVNRGTSGIEGFVASACGYAWRSQEKTLLVLGDLAFLHDLNSLSLIKREKINNLGIIVINNQEGTIFRNLPISNFFSEREKKLAFYGHDFSFKQVVKGFSLPYFLISEMALLQKTLKEAYELSSAFVLEIKVDNFTNQQAHEQLLRKVGKIDF